MSPERGFTVVLITAPNEDEGARIARTLVEESLAACVNMVKNIRSVYYWQGRVHDEAEALLIVKTRRELFGALSARVKELHSYEVPEIIALPVTEGPAGYLNWLYEATSGQRS
ncbi:MAG: divalent-cation tolerance protein CutA [Nitrospiraceae bacterium]|nr:divalent-cation tolerance protein CutA [Nitrospiraceae bacterium]